MSRAVDISGSYLGSLPDDAFIVLSRAWEDGGIALQSDFARGAAPTLALLASMGWLTVIDPDGRSYHPRWRLSAIGAGVLTAQERFARDGK